MEIEAIHAVLVHPKGEEGKLRGTEITLNGRFFNLLSRIFQASQTECKHDISFLRDEDELKENPCRTLFIAYLTKPSLVHAQAVAKRMQEFTDNRTGPGLVFLMAGKDKKQRRFLICRFPADFGILARNKNEQLEVELVEDVFLKNTNSYKSAVYEGKSVANDFWSGKAVDKQVNHDFPISAYWITDFLLSDFTTSGRRGTERLAVAMKKAMNKSTVLKVKEEIAAAVRLAPGAIGYKATSPAKFVKRLGLADETIQSIKPFMHSSLWEEEFRFVTEEFQKHVALQSMKLNNGAILSAQTEDFKEVFSVTRATDGGNDVVVTTKGAIVDEKLYKDHIF